MNLPTGTITLLFTDIEGSTQLWELFPDAMRSALVRHDDLLRAVIERHQGVVFKTVGDAFCAAFANAADAVNAALEAQFALQQGEWPETGPLRVRMAIHTGEAEERDNDYFGPTINRVARLLAIGYGQQTLLSQATYECVRDRLPSEATLEDRGLHRLKDLLAPERVYQPSHPSLLSEFPPLRSLDYLPTNLPQQLTSFIGREQEKANVKEWLPRTRLLTLTGPGGTGKTRLALQVAAEALEEYTDGVWFVELAALSEPLRVPQAVATALHLREEPGRTLTETIIASLQDKTLLLLLDNCEHLLEASARLAETLLTRCPGVRILATSREPLGILGEGRYVIPSLSLPEPKQPIPYEELPRYEAVQLFLDRAALQQPTFTLTEHNAAAVTSVCRQLDGIPLAIELATARMRAMPLEQIEARLDQCFRLLTSGSRTALPRQQTLRALMDWSYDLLNAQEKTLLHRLSVFAGGWDLQAAEQICSDEAIEDWEVPDLLLSLSDKSLVVFEDPDGKARYRLLETVRQYAREKLAAETSLERCEIRHRDYYLALAEEAAGDLQGPNQKIRLAQLDTDYENLRAALDISLRQEAETEAGLRLAAALQRFWAIRGHYSEGREYLNLFLARPDAPAFVRPQAEALFGAGLLAFYQSDYDAAQAALEASLTLQSDLGNKAGMAQALLNLGNVAYRRGDFTTARADYYQSATLRREIGDLHGESAALSNLGTVASSLGDHAEARATIERSLEIKRALGDQLSIAIALDNLGSVVSRMGDHATAYGLHEQSLTLQRELGNREGIATALGNLGNIAFWQGDYDRAGALYSESLEIREELGDLGGLAAVLSNLGAVAAKQGDLLRAQELYLHSLSIERKVSTNASIANTLIELSGITRDRGDLDAAQSYLSEAIDLLEKMSNPTLMLAAQEALKTLRQKQGLPL